MWKSPEALRDKSLMFTKEADMYSAGIVTAEILTRLEPYEEERNNMMASGNSFILKIPNLVYQLTTSSHYGYDVLSELQDTGDIQSIGK